MNSYTKLTEVIGQKRAIIDKLRAELAPLEEVLAMLEKDYDEISSLRLQLRGIKIDCDHAPAPTLPTAPTAGTALPEPSAPVKHATKQQQIFDMLTKPMTCGELKSAMPEVKSMESTLKVLRAKNVIELENSNARPLRYVRVNGVTGVPKLLHGRSASNRATSPVPVK